jgi:uncharacterized protein YdhG (YjbR/CyaY superfamily)
LRQPQKGARAKLVELRKIIKATAPKADERISYGMPYYEYKGRVAYFMLAKTHIGLYIPPPVIAEHQKELKEYGTSMATVRFPLDKKLPAALIKKLIKANEKERGKKEKLSVAISTNTTIAAPFPFPPVPPFVALT